MMLALLLSCASAPKTADTASDTAQQAGTDLSVLPTQTCGSPPYDLLPTEGMGELVDAEIQETYSLSASTLNLLLASYPETSALPPAQYDVTLYFIRYMTQNRGEPIEATGMVALPASSGPVPTLLWLHPTTGFRDACAPTAMGLEGAAFPVLFASYGLAVAAPDYLGMSGWGEPSGMLHPYIVAQPTALASLDSLRALVALAAQEGTTATPDPAQVMLWGASEGGFAALWTDRYAPYYAPEFAIQGVIAAVPATDPLALAAHGAVVAGPTALGLAAAQITMKEWYQAENPLSEILSSEPEDMPAILSEVVESTCGDDTALQGIETPQQIYTSAYLDAMQTGDPQSMLPWSCFLADGVLRTSDIPHASTAPVLMVLAEEDDLAIAAPAREDALALCAQGQTIELHTCAGADHVAGAIESLPLQLQWLQDRLAKKPLVEDALCRDLLPESCTGGE